ncbi:hypothetical protein BJF90_17740 [Pseudonocardia sp. CNS-004]|nr:hypothetical protein BJF90_17740 [Pseudonocardia sp. CNS-004]
MRTGTPNASVKASRIASTTAGRPAMLPAIPMPTAASGASPASTLRARRTAIAHRVSHGVVRA